MKVSGVVWAVFPIGEEKDVAAWGGVSMRLGAVYSLL